MVIFDSIMNHINQNNVSDMGCTGMPVKIRQQQPGFYWSHQVSTLWCCPCKLSSYATFSVFKNSFSRQLHGLYPQNCRPRMIKPPWSGCQNGRLAINERLLVSAVNPFIFDLSSQQPPHRPVMPRSFQRLKAWRLQSTSWQPLKLKNTWHLWLVQSVVMVWWNAQCRSAWKSSVYNATMLPRWMWRCERHLRWRYVGIGAEERKQII